MNIIENKRTGFSALHYMAHSLARYLYLFRYSIERFTFEVKVLEPKNISAKYKFISNKFENEKAHQFAVLKLYSSDSKISEHFRILLFDCYYSELKENDYPF